MDGGPIDGSRQVACHGTRRITRPIPQGRNRQRFLRRRCLRFAGAIFPARCLIICLIVFVAGKSQRSNLAARRVVGQGARGARRQMVQDFPRDDRLRRGRPDQNLSPLRSGPHRYRSTVEGKPHCVKARPDSGLFAQPSSSPASSFTDALDAGGGTLASGRMRFAGSGRTRS